MRINNLHQGMRLFHYSIHQDDYGEEGDYPPFGEDWRVSIIPFEVISFELYKIGDVKSLVVRNLISYKEYDVMKKVTGMSLYCSKEEIYELITEAFNDHRKYDLETIKNRKLIFS